MHEQYQHLLLCHFWNRLSARLAVFIFLFFLAHFGVHTRQPSLKWVQDPSELTLTIFSLSVQPITCPESFHSTTLRTCNAPLGSVMLWWFHICRRSCFLLYHIKLCTFKYYISSYDRVFVQSLRDSIILTELLWSDTQCCEDVLCMAVTQVQMQL